MAAKIPALNPGLGEEMFTLFMKIVGKFYKILVKSSLVLFISESKLKIYGLIFIQQNVA